MEIRLADDDGARLSQHGHGRGVAIGDVRLTHARRGRGDRSAHIEQVLQRNRNAVQRAAVPSCGDLTIRIVGLLACVIVEHRNEGVERRVALRDALQAPVDDRLGGRLPRFQRT